MNHGRLLMAVLCGCCLSACDVDRPWPPPNPSLERMIWQPRADSYDPSPWFADGKVMRPLPAGVVPYEPGGARRDIAFDTTQSGIATQTTEPSYQTEIPVIVDRELLELGARRFQVFCATCHGQTGNGQSAVATAMTLRKPPSLFEKRIVDFPVGRIFAVVSRGYGLMPSYSLQLDARSRWAVVAHLKGLQRRHDATTSRLGGEKP